MSLFGDNRIRCCTISSIHHARRIGIVPIQTTAANGFYRVLVARWFIEHKGWQGLVLFLGSHGCGRHRRRRRRHHGGLCFCRSDWNGIGDAGIIERIHGADSPSTRSVRIHQETGREHDCQYRKDPIHKGGHCNGGFMVVERREDILVRYRNGNRHTCLLFLLLGGGHWILLGVY